MGRRTKEVSRRENVKLPISHNQERKKERKGSNSKSRKMLPKGQGAKI